MTTFNMTADEVGALIERYVAKEGVTNADESNELDGSSEGLGSEGSTGMLRHRHNYPALKKRLEEKEKEIVRLMQLLKGHMALDELQNRLDETKGLLGYDRLLRAKSLSKEQVVEIRVLKVKLRDYHIYGAVMESEAVSRLSAYEEAIVKLDKLIASPFPNRDRRENAELKQIRERFAAIWELDCEDTVHWKGSGGRNILSPEHKLGEGLSDIL